MYCSKCGFLLDDEDIFCRQCGVKIKKAENEQDERDDAASEEEKKPVHYDEFKWNVNEFNTEKKQEEVVFDWREKETDETDKTEKIVETDKKQTGEKTDEEEEINKIEEVPLPGDEEFEIGGKNEMVNKPDNEATKALEEHIFGETGGEARTEQDKFFTFTKKNEEFQKLLDEEYEKIKKNTRNIEVEKVVEAANNENGLYDDKSQNIFSDTDDANKSDNRSVFEEVLLFDNENNGAGKDIEKTEGIGSDSDENIREDNKESEENGKNKGGHIEEMIRAREAFFSEDADAESVENIKDVEDRNRSESSDMINVEPLVMDNEALRKLQENLNEENKAGIVGENNMKGSSDVFDNAASHAGNSEEKIKNREEILNDEKRSRETGLSAEKRGWKEALNNEVKKLDEKKPDMDISLEEQALITTSVIEDIKGQTSPDESENISVDNEKASQNINDRKFGLDEEYQWVSDSVDESEQNKNMEDVESENHKGGGTGIKVAIVLLSLLIVFEIVCLVMQIWWPETSFGQTVTRVQDSIVRKVLSVFGKG